MTDQDMLSAIQQARQETGWHTPSLLVDFVLAKIDPDTDDDHAEHLRAQANRVLLEAERLWGAR
ncbi:hypothetical protein CG51_06070 [Haematobacter missouriensis]|uniref:Uncharacterized protein n=1 Tax=Haematobacter missouriensis TaxID=366616 RepID=A0A212AQD3_9RHOB|nr:hypothetical protein [Haematobacter missouriensis]KFI31056.1 hypothetical protein CG51_06070 [Haematobacter missouriensis]OWJ73918.1 hypothetical protein CDV53_14410 [Haematobacter missouriensis]OWJ83546.1 hypothetical protein CDV52_11005 [Haematobacter missouriensis]